MFCPNCGKQAEDGSPYCSSCGYALQPSGIQQPQSMINQPQGPYTALTNSAPAFWGGNMPVPGYPVRRREGRRGLIAGLITGGVLLVAAAVTAVILLTGGASVTGFWYSEERGEALEFKSDNSFYIYSASNEYEGEYTFDKSKSEGVITIENYDNPFTVDNDKMDVDGIGEFEKAGKDFNVKEFIAELPTTTPAPTEAPTPEPTPEPTITPQTVQGETMTLPFIFGECAGTYTGEVSGGLPDGYGAFTCPYADGTSWTYEGYWIAGHLNGQGRTMWDYGFTEEGNYANDFLNGEGIEYWYDRLYYAGGYLEGTSHGQGTLYSYFEEPIFTGGFSNGFIQETAEAREERLKPIKALCAGFEWTDLYDACSAETKTYAYVEGVVLDVYEYSADNLYYCDFLMYESGIEDANHIIQVFYRMSEGEPFITEGQTIKVWGTTAYPYSYTTEGNEYLVVPSIDAWSVE